MIGAHGSKEIGGGFVLGFGPVGEPVHFQAVGPAAKDGRQEHGLGVANAAGVFAMGNVELLVDDFHAPALAVELEPLRRAQARLGGAGEEEDDFRFGALDFASQAARLGGPGEGDLFAGDVDDLQGALFGPAFVDLRGGGGADGLELPRGKKPPRRRRTIAQCWLGRWAGCP